MGGSESVNKPLYSVQRPGSAGPGSSPIFVNPKSRTDLMSKCEYGNTLYETFNSAASRYPNNPYLGTRLKQESGFGPYKWLTYSQVRLKSQKYGWGLCELGLNQKDENGHSFLGIYSKNRAEWVMMDLACMSQSIISVPIYDTLQSDALDYIVEQTQMRVVACDLKSASTILELRKSGELQTLQIIIQFDEIPEGLIKEFKKVGLRVYSLEQLEKLKNSGSEHPPSPSSIFTLCYTSGTTGRAKGALIRHMNLISSLAGLNDISFTFTSSDVHLSYLPLAHVMERTAVHHLTTYGVSIGFFQGDVMKLKEDLAELKPTIFVSVPRLYNRFHDLISQQMVELRGAKSCLASRALSTKQENYRRSGIVTHSFWDLLVFKKVQNIFGGRVRMMVSGSAPLSGDVINFMKVVFSCPFIEGFGQTESCGVTCMTIKEERNTGIIGGPVTTAELKLEDVPDMNYLSSDVDQDGLPSPRGEICIRGPVVFAGYYKNPEITAQTIDQDGWLHTGDIGVRNHSDGSFKIIDRKKNFFKLQQGEYVSAEKIEMVYIKSYFIAQIFVYGDSLESYLVAIIVPDEAFIRKRWANENGFNDDESFENICKSKKLIKTIQADMEEKAKEGKLLGFELVKKIHLESKLWTPDDLLTPTMKLMRFNAKKKYETVISGLYQTGY